MYKLAQLKEAEVRGVVAALVDNGVLQVSSPAQFEKVASDTAALLDGYDYDINDVAKAAQYSMQKTASADAVTEAMGELTLHKLAGEISDSEFNTIANQLLKQAGPIDDAIYSVKGALGANSTSDKVKHYAGKGAEKAQQAAKAVAKGVKGLSADAQDIASSLSKKLKRGYNKVKSMVD